MIATIMQHKEVVGFRIFDPAEKKFMNVPATSVQEVVAKKQADIINLGIENNELVGTNGTIDRYPKVSPSGILLGEKSPLIVISQLGEVGYKVVDYKGKVLKVKTQEVVSYAKKNGIANGKVVSRDNIEFISSIVGNYDIEKIGPVKKTTAEEDLTARLYAQTPEVVGGGSVAKHTHVDVEIEIEDSDVFDAMSENQKNVIEGYYVWYTVEKYKALAKHVNLGIAIGKAEKLSEIRGAINWEFGGIKDLYLHGIYDAHCELGHPIRYAYTAIPENDRNNLEARITFGSNCASEFFNISKEDMNNLVKTRKLMSDEIKYLAEAVANEQESLLMSKISLIYAIIRKLGDKDRIIEVFGNTLGYAILSFVFVKLPIPMSLVSEIRAYVSKDAKQFYKLVFPEYSSLIDKIYEGDSKYRDIYYGAHSYLDFIATNRIEGEYAYNPLDDTSVKRTDVGRYNKEARYMMSRKLDTIKYYTFCTRFDYQELTGLFESLQKLQELQELVINSLKRLGLYDNYYLNLKRIAYMYASDCSENTDKSARITLYNAFNINPILTGSYYQKLQRYNSGHKIFTDQTSMDLMHDDIKLAVEYGFDRINSEFCARIADIAVQDGFKQPKPVEMKGEKEFISEVETEKAAKQSIEKTETQATTKEDEKKEAETVAEGSLDPVEKLKRLMSSHPEIKEDYGIKVAKDIVESGKSYKELTYKQRWRVDRTIEIYGGKVDEENSSKPSDDNNVYDLDDHIEIKQKVQRIISKADSVEMQSVLSKYPSVLKIAYTIEKYNKASDRQMKFIDAAIEMLDNA